MGSDITLSIILALRDEATSKAQTAAQKLGDIKTSLAEIGVAAAAAFYGVTDFANSAVEAATAQQNAQAQLSVAIQSTGNAAGVSMDQMDALASSLSKTTGYTEESITSVETLLVGMKDIGSDAIPAATQAILDFAARTGTDAVSAAQQLGKALADPAIAVGTLTREHVILSDAQKQSIADFVGVGDKADAQKVILDALKGVVGGAAEQTDTFAFQQRALNAELDKANVAIGTALLPILTSLLQKIEPIIDAVTNWAEKHPKLTAALLIGTAAITGLTVVVSALALAVLSFDVVMVPVAGTILLVVVAILALIAAGYEIYENWDLITEGAQVAWELISAAVGTAVGTVEFWFLKIKNELTKTWNDTWKAIGDSFTSVWDGIVTDAKDGMNDIIDIMNALISAIDKLHISIPSVNIGGVKIGGYDIGFDIPQIPKLAEGGIVSGPTLALIGEAGPEAVVPLGRGGALGGLVVNVNGGYYLDQRAAADFGNMLAKTIGQQLKLRSI